MFEEHLPNEWYVAINGNQRDELYELEKVREFHLNSPDSKIQVLNSKLAHNPDAVWLEYREVDEGAKNRSDTVGFSYILAIVIPIVGFFLGLALITNDKTRTHGVGIVTLSVVLGIIYGAIIATISSQ